MEVNYFTVLYWFCHTSETPKMKRTQVVFQNGHLDPALTPVLSTGTVTNTDQQNRIESPKPHTPMANLPTTKEASVYNGTKDSLFSKQYWKNWRTTC